MMMVQVVVLCVKKVVLCIAAWIASLECCCAKAVVLRNIVKTPCIGYR